MNVVRANPQHTPAEELFQPVGGQPLTGSRPFVFPALSSRDATQLPPAEDFIALEALPDERVLLLQVSQVLVYRDGASSGEVLTLSLGDILEEGAAFTLQAHDFAYVPAERSGEPGRLAVVAVDGNQAFVFSLDLSGGQARLTPLPEYLPMRLFEGRALVSAQGRLFYDMDGGFIPLVAQRLPRYEKKAVLLTEPKRLDGRQPGCVWHRLFLDASIPPGTSVQVRSRAADTPLELMNTPFSQEPEPYLRSTGPELPFAPGVSGEHRGTWELLFQHPRGRYLQLELTLCGTGGVTPRLRALRAYYPRTSYAERFLPAIYREDSDSVGFLERFLANLEGILTPIEDRIAAAQVLFDARSAPAEALEWLAGWLGLAFDPAWEKEERRRRLLIRHAHTFFQWRGTPRGLRMALRLALDERPDASLFEEQEDPLRSPIRIDEHFRSARGARSSKATAHRFTVFIPVPREVTEEQLDTLLARARRVVELEKPAHTVFDVRFYWAMFRVGEARLGVNTPVSLGSRAPEARRAVVLGRAHLAEAFLHPRPGHAAAGQWELGRHQLTHHSTPGGELR
ncbi:phage tail protein [Archangium violaceum]